MKLLDLYSGAGGCSVGYYRAGFTDIVGVDFRHQPRYPFKFVCADALEYVAEHGHKFDLIHASPPCQVHSVTASLSNGKHLDLVPQTRAALIATGKPYIIENVPGAPLINPLMLCGTMFGLNVIRHRLFECNPVVWFPPTNCKHDGRATGNGGGSTSSPTRRGRVRSWSHAGGAKFITITGNDYLADEGRAAMAIDWMVKKELSQAIPPAFTEWLGRAMMELLGGEA